MADAPPAEAQNSTSLNLGLREAEQHWAWKFGLRAVICVLNLVGTGCAAWLTAYAVGVDADPGVVYFTDENVVNPGAIVAMGLSFIWCLTSILVLLLRRPRRPIHPGVTVGVDLVLWLAFIVTGLFVVAAIFDIAYFGSGGYIEDPSENGGKYDGDYYLAPNNTWVYNITYVTTSGYGYGGYIFNYTTGTYTYNTTTPKTSSVHRVCKPYFDTCAEQDAYINKLWHSKTRREDLEIVVAAVQWLNVILHFTLFVWACVDTHRKNVVVNQRKTREVADRVIADMQARGLITVHQAGNGSEIAQPEPPMSQTTHEIRNVP